MNYLTYLNRYIPMFEADGKGGGGDPKDEPKAEPKAEPKTDPKDEKRYSDKDLDAIIQKKFAKWKSDEEKRVKEAEKLAGMSAAEKAEHEMQEALKRAEAAEAKLAHLDLVKEARTVLAEKKVSVSDELLEVLVGKDAETTKANIDSFAGLFQKAVDEAVKEKLKGKTPKSAGKATMTKEEINRIADPIARRKAIAENMSLYE